MDDLISRKAAIELVDWYQHEFSECDYAFGELANELHKLPSAEPTLYGYKIEHLAYIAMVMEKEGVTAEYAVRTFDDMGRAVKMVIDEVHETFKRSMEEWIQT